MLKAGGDAIGDVDGSASLRVTFIGFNDGSGCF